MNDGYDITWAAGSTVAGRRKNNWTATTAPSTEDDSDGYEAGSLWLDTVGEALYFCVEVATPTWQNLSLASSGDSYQHAQGSADTTWTVNHNLGRYPAVTVIDSGGSEIEVSVEHSTLNQAILTLEYATSGIATCS